jgi:predicted MFS family arabinose efflux permease
VTRLRDLPWFRPVLAASFAAFAGWSLLLPVVPMAVARGGGSSVQAGGTTTAFMAATVVAQVFVSALLRRWGYRLILVAGCLLLAVPCILMMLRTPLVWWYVAAVLRGLGFGLLTVATTALIGRLTPQPMLGRATGLQGAVIGSATAIALPAGIAVANTVGMTAILSVGVALPIVSIVGLRRLPSLREGSTDETEPVLRASAVWLVTTSAVMGLTGAAFGSLTTLIPIGAVSGGFDAGMLLLLIGGLSMAGRYGAGVCVDRLGSGRIVVVALLVGAASLGGLGAGVDGSMPWLLALAAAAFGLAYGVVQTETIVLTYLIAGAGGVAMASTYYNIGVDLGIGVGSLTQGVVAEILGVPVAIAASGLFTAAAVVPAALAVRHLRRLTASESTNR